LFRNPLVMLRRRLAAGNIAGQAAPFLGTPTSLKIMTWWTKHYLSVHR
jgi:hypothetical protein